MIHLNAPIFDTLGAYIAGVSEPSKSFVYIPVEVAREIVGEAELGDASQRCVRCGSRSLCVCLCVHACLCVRRSHHGCSPFACRFCRALPSGTCYVFFMNVGGAVELVAAERSTHTLHILAEAGVTEVQDRMALLKRVHR